MALYTTVGDDFCVFVYHNLTQLFDAVKDESHFLDEEETRPVTKRALALELKQFGEARIYQTNYSDWYLKIQKH